MAFQAFRYDTDAFEEGVWEEFNGGHFKIAYIDNLVYREAQRQGKKRLSLEFSSEDLARQDRQAAEAMAKGLLKDWSEVEGKDQHGNTVSVEYSVQNATETLLADPELVAFVLKKARELDRFERGKAA